MTEIDIITTQYVKTIVDLQARLANAALELANAMQKIEQLEKEKADGIPKVENPVV